MNDFYQKRVGLNIVVMCIKKSCHYMANINKYIIKTVTPLEIIKLYAYVSAIVCIMLYIIRKHICESYFILQLQNQKASCVEMKD